MANIDEILERLFDHLRELAPPGVVLDEETDLIGTLGLESITVINMVLEIEDEYDISVPLNELSDVRTAGELARLVHRLTKET